MGAAPSPAGILSPDSSQEKSEPAAPLLYGFTASLRLHHATKTWLQQAEPGVWSGLLSGAGWQSTGHLISTSPRFSAERRYGVVESAEAAGSFRAGC